MVNVVIDSGIIPHYWIDKSLEKTDFNVFFVGDDKDIEKLEKSFPNINCLRYTELSKRTVYKNLYVVASLYNRIFNTLFSDIRTIQISERTFTTLKPWDNHIFSQIPFLSKIICSYIDYIEEIKPNFIFFQATPHNIYSYLFGRVAELMGIKVFLSKTSSLPWKSFLVSGIHEQLVQPLNNNFVVDTDIRLDSFFSLNSQKYDDAIPSYEKKRILERKGKFWSWKTELKEALYAPHRIVAVLRKYRLYKLYQSLSIENINVKKYVIVFLHYQPERTSLPEGAYFTQQSHLIRTLSLGLPKDYTLLVKEHPSMFVGSLDIRYRNKSFYEDIASLNNVKLVSVNFDSFSLIDNCICIATITGTVGIQALIRGKAVLAFGLAAYRDFKYCYQICNVEDVKRSIEEIELLKPEIISVSYKDYLREMDFYSVNGIDDEIVDNIDYYNQDYRLNADGKILYSLLCR